MKITNLTMSISFVFIFIAFSVVIILLTMWFINRISPQSRIYESFEGESYLKTEDGSIRYQVKYHPKECSYSGHTVLFLHGFNGELGMWSDTWDNLNSCADLIRLDIPGYGESTWNTNDFTLATQAKRILAFMNHKQIDKAFVVGTSMGGSLSALLAANYPERFNAAVLLAPSGFTGALTYNDAFGKLISPGWFNTIGKFLTATKIYKTLFSGSKALQAISVVSSYGDEWTKKTKEITTPVTLVWSTGDSVVPFAFAAPTASLIENSALLPIDKTVGHNIPRNNGAFVAKVVQLMLNGLTPNEIKSALVDHLDLSTPLTI